MASGHLEAAPGRRLSLWNLPGMCGGIMWNLPGSWPGSSFLRSPRVPYPPPPLASTALRAFDLRPHGRTSMSEVRLRGPRAVRTRTRSMPSDVETISPKGMPSAVAVAAAAAAAAHRASSATREKDKVRALTCSHSFSCWCQCAPVPCCANSFFFFFPTAPDSAQQSDSFLTAARQHEYDSMTAGSLPCQTVRGSHSLNSCPTAPDSTQWIDSCLTVTASTEHTASSLFLV